MNLETSLEPRLWDAVRASLEARKFTPAILDAIHVLTDVVRERSGLEGDGVALIGAAFGGHSPKLKVNRLQTDSEQNVQRGLEAMLRGLYQAIRNPRSHDAYQDTERDAKALLLFVDYLLRVVDKSGSPFSLPALVARILDPDFVPSDRYAELLVAEIPAKKRLATCRELFARRSEADADKVRFFFEAALAQMSDDDTVEILHVVSQELRETNDEATIRFVLTAFRSTLWPRLDEIARLRIENKLIASVSEGKWIRRLRRCTPGSLGTWTSRILHELTLKDEFWSTIDRKLGLGDTEEQDYALNYFAGMADQCFDAPPLPLKRCVLHGLKSGDDRFKVLADGWGLDDEAWERRKPDHPWRQPFVNALAEFKPAPETPDITTTDDSEIPF